jgi:hypothetical protein
MADITSKLANLPAAERAALLAKLRGTTRPGRLAPRSTADAPASFVQEQMWMLNYLAPNEPAYNVPFALELTGPLDVDAVRATVRELTRRHEVLRGRLVLKGGRLVQEFVDRDVPTPLEDLSTVSPEQVERRIFTLARGLFDLATGPLVHTTLIRTAPERHVLMWVAHHTVVDGWSYGVLIEEFAAIHRATATGVPHTLPAPRLQFGDFALWQRERLTGDRLEALLTHWETRLGTAPPGEIKPDRPRPPAQTYRGAKVSFSLPDELTARLRGLGGGTLFTVLLSAFELVVAQYGRTDRPSVGTPIAGRVSPELEPLVGPFSNTVPLRVDLSGDPPFHEVMARVGDVLMDAAEHQEVPFGKLVDRLQSGRDASRNPLFQVLMNMGNLPQGVRTVEIAPGLTLLPRGVPNDTARVDLELTFEPAGDHLGGRLEYNTDLFDRSTAERVIEHLRAVLAAVAADRGVRLSELPWPLFA